MTKRESSISPLGTFMWAHVVEPQRKFNPEGRYEINLVLPPEEGEKFKAQLEALYEQEWEKFITLNPKKKKMERRPMSIRPVEDEEGNETGDLSFKFAVNARGKTREGVAFDRRVVIADSNGNRVDPESLSIGNGTRGRVSFSTNAYNSTAFGMSLQLKGIQIVDLVEFAGGPQFDPVEDGWTPAGVSGGDEGADY